MRLATIIRISLLGLLIAAGVILYPRTDTTVSVPAEATSLAPSPVTVTPLPGRTS